MNKRGLPLVIVAALLLLASGVASTGSTAAQETTPASATLTGTAYRLVYQTIVDGYVVDETKEPVTDGRIAIPELGIDEPLAANGSFRFTNLPVSGNPDVLTDVTVIFTAPNLGSYTFLNLRLYPGAGGPILRPLLIATPRVNDVSYEHRHGVFDDLPQAGGGGPMADAGSPVAPALIAFALVGAALLCAGAATRFTGRTSCR